MLAPAAMAQTAAKPAFSMFSTLAPDPNQWTRSFSHYIDFQHDGGLAGDDEMEIFANVNNSYQECRRYTGLKQNVQYFRNINGNIGRAWSRARSTYQPTSLGLWPGEVDQRLVLHAAR
jgi:hypothetical protein